MRIVVATQDRVLSVDAQTGDAVAGTGHGALARPTCLARDPLVAGRVWCGTKKGGVLRSDDGGVTWRAAGLAGERIESIAASPAAEGLVWAGTEPSAVFRSRDAGESWDRLGGLEELPSSSEWSFPPKPDTHHVRWIACHPQMPERLWVAIEAGALISTVDAGETWRDRVRGGPFDTHELGIHAAAPDTLRVAAGDGYYESFDGGRTWSSPSDGLEVGYLRSVAIDAGDPDAVVVSAASRPHSAYMAGKADGRLFRRAGGGRWQRVLDGWPEPARTIAPLLVAGTVEHELWAADERGVHRSTDGGRCWRRAAELPGTIAHLRGLAVAS